MGHLNKQRKLRDNVTEYFFLSLCVYTIYQQVGGKKLTTIAWGQPTTLPTLGFFVFVFVFQL